MSRVLACTPTIAVEAARRILGGQHSPGFETRARMSGAGFAQAAEGTRIIDLGESTR
ncbi:hypothetical protein [Variovorax paradoxus]|uniref:hypothetical protein n=1 Tax=Variovorax paradoxus TaxID=34073 RepID=UPI0012D3F93E|nr:hypothetical protein [Variovorax paradoxus]